VPDDKDTVERAKEILVYGPIGLAMYVKDTAPSFLKVFVARGRAEVEQRRRAVGDQLGQVRHVGESAAEGGGPQVLRFVSDGLARVRETAEGALGALGGLSGDAAGFGTPRPDTIDDVAPDDSAARASSDRSSGRGDPGLVIADYDALSASQVVDRLDGLDPDALEAIRAHEVAHRARATILGKIDQLTRAD
jgi:hypothetical protein